MTRFSELPDSARWAYRDLITSTGAEVDGYDADCVRVSLPNPAAPAIAALEAGGLELVEGGLYWFPLGTDAPPQHLRHDGRYPGSAGFWLYARFRPVAAAELVELGGEGG
jgi:hypothetical protein